MLCTLQFSNFAFGFNSAHQTVLGRIILFLIFFLLFQPATANNFIFISRNNNFFYIYKYWLINASNFDDLILFRDDFEIYCKETNVVRSIAKQRNKNNVRNMPTFSPGFLILKEKTVGVLVQSFC